jgi:hypothetical protein
MAISKTSKLIITPILVFSVEDSFQACGENPSAVYSGTRMDNIWSMRQAYQAALEKKREQDAYCERVLAHSWDGLEEFPESLQWEVNHS